MTERFDAIVIGSGQGGNPLAVAMAKHGWNTAIVERRAVGGTCVNFGCTPTKTLVATARVAYLAKRAKDFGVQAGPAMIDMKAAIARQSRPLHRNADRPTRHRRTRPRSSPRRLRTTRQGRLSSYPEGFLT